MAWRQAIIRTNAVILLTKPLRTNFSEISIEIHTFSFKEMHLKMSSGKWRPFCLGLNVLIYGCQVAIIHHIFQSQSKSHNTNPSRSWDQPSNGILNLCSAILDKDGDKWTEVSSMMYWCDSRYYTALQTLTMCMENGRRMVFDWDPCK